MKTPLCLVAALALSTVSAQSFASEPSNEGCKKMIQGFKDGDSWMGSAMEKRFKEFRKVCFGKGKTEARQVPKPAQETEDAGHNVKDQA